MRGLLSRPIAGVQAWRYLYLLAFIVGALHDLFGTDTEVDELGEVDEDASAPRRRRVPARFDVDELERVAAEPTVEASTTE